MFFKMTAKRWFWMLLLACTLWAWFGIRTSPKTAVWTHPSFMDRTQQFVSKPVDMLLTPIRFVPKLLQQAFFSMVTKILRPPASAATTEDTRNRIRILENELLYQSGRNALLEEHIRAQKILVDRGIDPRYLLQATITGFQAGAATNTVILDKGSHDGVKGPYPVLSELSLIGRISSVGPKVSTLRLITDPRVKVQASIVRRTPTGLVAIVSNCLVTGVGQGRMETDTPIASAPVKPLPGDLVLLTDPEWPVAVRNTVLGEVTEVGRKESRFLLYDIHIIPRVNIHSISSVIVVMGE